MIYDDLVLRQILTIRYGNHVAKILRKHIRDIRKDILATVNDYTTRTRLLKEIDLLVRGKLANASEELTKELLEFFADEADVTKKILIDNTTLTTAMATTSAAATKKAHKGVEKYIADLFKTLSSATIDNVVNTVEDGLRLKKTFPEISKDVNHVIKTITPRQAESVAHTAVSYTANAARAEVYKEFSKYIEHLRFTAMLDLKTTRVCAKNDGKVFKVGKEIPLPLHYGCRSMYVPKIKDFYNPKGMRVSIGGLVDGDTIYPEWLRSQSKEKIIKALGKTRAEMFISGEYEIKDFVNDKGRTLTIDELRRA